MLMIFRNSHLFFNFNHFVNSTLTIPTFFFFNYVKQISSKGMQSTSWTRPNAIRANRIVVWNGPIYEDPLGTTIDLNERWDWNTSF